VYAFTFVYMCVHRYTNISSVQLASCTDEKVTYAGICINIYVYMQIQIRVDAFTSVYICVDVFCLCFLFFKYLCGCISICVDSTDAILRIHTQICICVDAFYFCAFARKIFVKYMMHLYLCMFVCVFVVLHLYYLWRQCVM